MTAGAVNGLSEESRNDEPEIVVFTSGNVRASAGGVGNATTAMSS